MIAAYRHSIEITPVVFSGQEY